MEFLMTPIIALMVFAVFKGLSFVTANQSIATYPDQRFRLYPVAAAAHIYKGTSVGINPAGYLKAFEPGDNWVGIATEEKDNSAGAAGAVSCEVQTVGDVALTIASVAASDAGRPVYALSDYTYGFTGHPDAFVGRLINKETTNLACVRMKAPGQMPGNGEGSVVLGLTGYEAFTATGATAGTSPAGAYDLKSILGLGLTMADVEDAGHLMTFDAVAEVALNSCRTQNDCLPIDKGITFEVELCVNDKGDDVALDIDFGLGTALTTNSEASVDHADMVQLACFHMDGNSDNVLAQSDDNTTDVAVVDTTIDNDSTTDIPKKYKIIVRPTGVVEFWCDSGAGYVRLLASTAFTMLSTANVGAFINMEKISNDTTAALVYRKLRVAGGIAA